MTWSKLTHADVPRRIRFENLSTTDGTLRASRNSERELNADAGRRTAMDQGGALGERA